MVGLEKTPSDSSSGYSKNPHIRTYRLKFGILNTQKYKKLFSLAKKNRLFHKK